MKYSDVKRFYLEKYGKRIGELRFKLYLARKQGQKKKPKTEKIHRRINLFVF
jgi:hypothetical protein